MSNKQLPPELVEKMDSVIWAGNVEQCAQIAVEYAREQNLSLKTALNFFDEEINILKQQRDELVAVLEEVKEFLGHIQPKIGKQAFNEIWDTVEESLNKIGNNEK